MKFAPNIYLFFGAWLRLLINLWFKNNYNYGDFRDPDEEFEEAGWEIRNNGIDPENFAYVNPAISLSITDFRK